MECTKAFQFIEDKAKYLKDILVKALGADQDRLRISYYYYGLVRLAASSCDDPDMNQEIQTAKTFIQSLGYDDIKAYGEVLGGALLHSDRDGEGPEKYLKEAEKIAQNANQKLGVWHLLMVFMKYDFPFMKKSYCDAYKAFKEKNTSKYILQVYVYEGDKKLAAIDIKGGCGDIVIGRDESCNLIIRKKDISRKHAILRYIEDGCTLLFWADAGSKYGTYLSGQRLQQEKGFTFIGSISENCVRLSSNIMIYTRMIPANAKEVQCRFCNTRFQTNNPEENLCFDCKLKMKKELGIKEEKKDVVYCNLFFEEQYFMPFYGKKFSLKARVTTEPGCEGIVSWKGASAPKIVEKKEPIKPAEPVFQAGDIIPGYKLVKKLGEGGMGVVYLVEERATKKVLALKFIKEELMKELTSVEKFIREAKLHMQFSHKYVAKVYDAKEFKGKPYLLMEYYSEGNLRDYFAKLRDQKNKYEVSRKILLQILEGLDYLHHAEVRVKLKEGNEETFHGIVHRDLKPENIFVSVDKNGEVEIKIADFGMSKAFEAAGLSGETLTGDVGGTLPYMPRQQIIDYKYCKPDVDVWAATASIYILLTGMPPKRFREGVSPYFVIINENAVLIRKYDKKVPFRYAKIIDKALVDKELYYKNARDLIRDLEKIKC